MPAHERRSAQALTEKFNVAVLDEISTENFRTVDTLIFRCSHNHYLDIVVDKVCDEREVCQQGNVNHPPKCEPLREGGLLEEFKLLTNKEALKKIMLMEREVLRHDGANHKLSDPEFEKFWAKGRFGPEGPQA